MNRRRTGFLVSGLTGSAVLVGCSSTPVVTYDKYNTNTKIEAKDLNSVPNTYELWTTQLEFVKDVSKPMTVSVGAAPVSSGATVLSITGESHWYKSTDVKLATASDSNLLSSVSVSVTDNRASYVTTAGELLGTVLAVAGVALAPEPNAVPPSQPSCGAGTPVPRVDVAFAFDEVVNLFDALKKAEAKGNCTLSDMKTVKFLVGNADDGVGNVAVVTISPPPLSAVLIDDSSLPVIKSTAKNVFLYSACRQATVEYMGAGPVTQKPLDGQSGDSPLATPAKPGDSAPDHGSTGHPPAHGAPAHAPEPAVPPTPPATPSPSVVHRQAQFLFADPRYVQAIQMPVKGTLTVKSECGMTAGADSGTADSGPAMAKAIADALQGLTGKSASGSGKSTGKTNATGN